MAPVQGDNSMLDPTTNLLFTQNGCSKLGAASGSTEQHHASPGPTFFRGALLHEPGCPDIVLGGVQAAGFEETRGRTGMESDSDHLLILACKHQRTEMQEEEMSETYIRKQGASPAWEEEKAPSQQSSATVEIISEQRVTTAHSQQ